MTSRSALLGRFLSVALLAPTPAWASATLQSFTVTGSGPSSGLFTNVGAQSAANVQYSDAAWPVTLNLALLTTLPSSIVANFPDRAWVTLTRTRSQPRGANAFIWTGRGGDCVAFLRQAPTSFKGQIGCKNANYEVSAVPDGSGLQLVRAVAPPGTVQADIGGPPPGPLNFQSPSQPSAPATLDTSIDVLVLYSPAVRMALDSGGGTTNTTLLAHDAVDQTQQVLDNSVPLGNPPLATINFLGAQEVLNTLDDGNFQHNLDYLTVDNEAKNARAFWGADILMYLRTQGADPNLSGLSHQPGYLGLPLPAAPGQPQPYAAFASAVLQYNCALMVIGAGPSCTDYYVFPHEFAHNFGANHNIENSPWPNYPNSYNPPGPIQPYAFGRYGNVAGDNGGYRTIMSYIEFPPICNSPCSRIAYYSNPDVTTPDNFKTGVAGKSANALMIQTYASATAQYSPSKTRIFFNGFEGVQ